MRPFLLVAINAMFALSLGSTAVAAAGPEHETMSGTDTVADFCGTGESVEVSVKGVFNNFDEKGTGHATWTWTNPQNGATVLDSFSGGGRFVGVIDDGDGAYTLVFNRQGMPTQIRLSQGQVLLQDAGLVIFYDHYDAQDNYLGTDVVVRGPHPNLEAGFDLWCVVMVDALGV